jgi:hypothetical protein
MTSTTAATIAGILSVIIAGSLSAMGAPSFLVLWFIAVYVALFIGVTYFDRKR